AVGNWAMMLGERIRQTAVLSGNAVGGTLIYVSVDHQYAGFISVSDPLKQSAETAVRDLKQQGVRIVMLTGDNRVIAQSVARQLGIDEFHTEVLPADKARIVKDLQQQGRVVAMAGDGIN